MLRRSDFRTAAGLEQVGDMLRAKPRLVVHANS